MLNNLKSNFTKLRIPYLVLLIVIINISLYIIIPRFRFLSIIVHHTASNVDNYQTIRKLHRQRGWGDAAYHLILSNGSTQVPPGYLEPTSRYRYLFFSRGTRDPWCNTTGVHLCIVGNYEEYEVPSELRPAIGHAITCLQRKYGISTNRVYFHRDCSPSACPGKYITKKKIKTWMKELAQHCPEELKLQHERMIGIAYYSIYTMPQWAYFMFATTTVFISGGWIFMFLLMFRRKAKGG